MGLTASPASANPITYTFQLNTPSGNPVTDLVIYSADATTDNVNIGPEVLSASGLQTLTFSTPFDPTRMLVVGLNEDAINGTHIIMFADEAFAASAVGLRWNQLFAPIRHSAMINYIAGAHSGDAASLTALTDFFRGLGTAATFSSPTSFSILQFSLVPPPIGASLPEPGSLLLLGSGLGVAAGVGRWRSLKRAASKDATPR